jgi:type IV secretion system protein VirB9
MIRNLTLSIAIALALHSAATIAVDMPQSSKYDNRIQHVNYNAGDVVVVRTVPGISTRVVFSPGENVLDIASGFTQGWNFQDRENVLYIKPQSIKGENGQPSMPPEAGKWNTNLLVKTNLRLYDFDLHLLPGSNSGAPATNQRISYRVEFRYPEEEAEKAKKALEAQAAKVKLDAKTAPRNWNYSMQVGPDSEGIAPTLAYDDGRFTYLKFPNNRDFPAVFLVAADKTESLVNTHVDKDVMVIQRVTSELVLRLGNAVVGIYNDSYDIDGVPANGGTTVPGVKRVIISGEETNHE